LYRPLSEGAEYFEVGTPSFSPPLAIDYLRPLNDVCIQTNSPFKTENSPSKKRARCNFSDDDCNVKKIRLEEIQPNLQTEDNDLESISGDGQHESSFSPIDKTLQMEFCDLSSYIPTMYSPMVTEDRILLDSSHKSSSPSLECEIVITDTSNYDSNLGENQETEDHGTNDDQVANEDQETEEIHDVEEDPQVVEDHEVEEVQEVNKDLDVVEDHEVNKDQEVEKVHGAKEGSDVVKDQEIVKEHEAGEDQKVEEDHETDGYHDVVEDQRVEKDHEVYEDDEVVEVNEVVKDHEVGEDQDVNKDQEGNEDLESEKDQAVMVECNNIVEGHIEVKLQENKNKDVKGRNRNCTRVKRRKISQPRMKTPWMEMMMKSQACVPAYVSWRGRIGLGLWYRSVKRTKSRQL